MVYILFLALVLAMLPVQSIVVQQELITNGSFENGLSGWTVTTKGNGEVVVTTERAYSGSHSARLRGGVYTLSRIEQSVEPVGSYIFNIAVYLKWIDYPYYGYPAAYIILYPGIEIRILPTQIKVNDKIISYNARDHWFTIMIVGNGDTADVYIDGEYKTTVSSTTVTAVRLETGQYTSGHYCDLYAYFDSESLRIAENPPQ